MNDAAAIALFILLLGFIEAGRQPSAVAGLGEFILLFVGGGVFGYLAGRLLLWSIRQISGDRLAEATLTLAFTYFSFVAAERLFHVSGVVAVLTAGLTLSALGPARISPGELVFPHRTLGADRFLGALFDLCIGLHPRTALVGGRRMA